MLQAVLFFIQHDYKGTSIICLYSNNPISGNTNMQQEDDSGCRKTHFQECSISFTISISQSLYNFNLSTENGY